LVEKEKILKILLLNMSRQFQEMIPEQLDSMAGLSHTSCQPPYFCSSQPAGSEGTPDLCAKGPQKCKGAYATVCRGYQRRKRSHSCVHKQEGFHQKQALLMEDRMGCRVHGCRPNDFHHAR